MNYSETMKIILLKKYFNVVLLGDDSLSWTERLQYLWKSLLTFGPVAIILDAFNLWFDDNKLFFSAVVAFIFVNMTLGAYMHGRKKSFSWFILLQKTLIMIIVVMLTYAILELILKVAGSNIITEGFRAALQVATLLYPGSKILKNIFILSKGEHPPKWIMQKIYNFQENGDLSEFLSTKKDDDDLPPDLKDGI